MKPYNTGLPYRYQTLGQPSFIPGISLPVHVEWDSNFKITTKAVNILSYESSSEISLQSNHQQLQYNTVTATQ